MNNVMGSSQEYVEQNVLRFLNTRSLKPYFNVSTSYVMRKLRLLLFPWRHKPWSRQMRRNEVSGATEGYEPPREDINAPDLYIPGKIYFQSELILVMAFVTYILMSAFLSGLQGHFNPEEFSVTASYAFAVVLFEMVAIKLGCYLLSIGGQGQVLDLVAYGGYKFVGIVVTMLVRLVGILNRKEGAKKGWGRWIEWNIFIYCFLCLGFFMV
jgi:protein transport protein YIF1